jgi:hypothetical protein
MTEEEKVALAAETQKKIDEATAQLKADLAAKEAELAKEKSVEKNFNGIKSKAEMEVKAAEDARLAKEAEALKLSERVAELETNISKAAEERKSKLVTAYAGKDAELQKTILFHFDRVKGEAKTDAEIEAAMKDAYVLATGGRADQDVIRQVQGSGSSGARVVAKPVGTDVTPEAKTLADEFNKHGANIKPEDLANPKYAVKANQSAESNYTL